MRTFALFGLVLVTHAAIAAPTADQELFKGYLLSGKEPKVKDATWMSDTNLYVGVVDDGSNRSGFAEYLCLAAANQGVYPEMIKVVDIAKVVREQRFHELGRSYCPSQSDAPTEVQF
ncbi:hypothetical protein NNO07_15030 [Pseudomonas resinovorans]|uniref:Rap1a immunity protein domain-containing protein n=1 Tax=Metapseudomonas resinovorans TaxID=53412 RepID=A0ABT4Y697_METRE|nr:hypothetical protein [Pseudomonas resinovorans]MDA8484387.1 hypothetical protein [Pseudomonas resinovorans]